MKKVVFILDETGSMSSIQSDAYGSYNTFIKEQEEAVKKSKDEVSFSLILFSKLGMGEPVIRPVYEDVPYADIEEFTADQYSPCGTTPLLDAIGQTIDSLDDEEDVMIVVMTDGLENASMDYTKDRVKSMIEEKRDEGWEFAFLGANMDAVSVGTSLGVNRGQTQTFNATPQGVRAAYTSASAMTSSYISDEDDDDDDILTPA